MKINGVMDDNPFVADDTVVMAIYQLCDMFMRANPIVTTEDAAVVAECAAGTVVFRGTPDEMLCFAGAVKLVLEKYEDIRKSGDGFPSAQAVRFGMENLKLDIIAAMSFRKQCAPQSSLQEAFRRLGPC